MIKSKNSKNISLNLVSHHTNPFDNLRENVLMYISQPDITLKNLADESGIPLDTLKSLIYGKVTDCKVSTAEKLARALGVSVDELIGSHTLDLTTLKYLANCRYLPEHQLYLVRWFIERQVAMAQDKECQGKKIISIIKPACSNGCLKMTNVMESMCIDHLPEHIRSNVYLGITLGCDHYMPYYSPYDTLLIAANRPTQNGEVCVVIYSDNILIVRKRVIMEGNEARVEYLGLENDSFRISDSDIDSKIGYVVDVCHCKK